MFGNVMKAVGNKTFAKALGRHALSGAGVGAATGGITGLWPGGESPWGKAWGGAWRGAVGGALVGGAMGGRVNYKALQGTATKTKFFTSNGMRFGYKGGFLGAKMNGKMRISSLPGWGAGLLAGMKGGPNPRKNNTVASNQGYNRMQGMGR